MRGYNEVHHGYEVLATNNTTTPSESSQNSASLLFIISVIISIVGLCMLFECIKRYIKSKRLSSDAIISAEVRCISDPQYSISAETVEGLIDPSIADAVRADQMPVSEVVISIDKRDSEAVTRMRLDAALPLYQRWELAPSEENQVKVVQATVVHEEI